MNELQLVENINIKDYIYEIRGKQVMLASDVAKLYNVETFRINEVVKRNINRFPSSFCFQLTKEDWIFLRSQIAISKDGRGGVRYLQYVFTEHGIMMLSGLLKSEIAAFINVYIINAFVEMRKLISKDTFQSRLTNVEQKLIDMDNNFTDKFLKSDKNFEILFSELKSPKNTHLFFDGQIYDAYSLLIDILNEAKESVIIIDNYIDKNILDIISKIHKKVNIITKNIDKRTLSIYKKQYDNIDIIIDNKYHDRFIILDNKVLYHSGASFKDLGKNVLLLIRLIMKIFLKYF